MNEWKDVNDELPNFSAWVIVSLRYANDVVHVTTGTYDNGQWKIDREIPHNKGIDYTVTHWMWFPKTPWEINAGQNGTAIE